MKILGMKQVIIIMCMMMISMVAQAAGWTITDLGTLGGSSSHASGINNRGQVVGTSSLAGDVSHHAFLYTNGGMYDLGTLGGTNSSAADINASGQIVGTSDLNGNLETRGFIYSAGKMVSIGTLPLGVRSSSIAYGINNRGQVVGMSHFLAAPQAPRDTLLAVSYEHGILSRFDNDMYIATANNNRGQIVGNILDFGNIPYRPRAVLFSAGKLTQLGTLYEHPDSTSMATGINNAGVIVGHSGVPNNASQAFVYRNGKMSNLGASLGFASSVANGINNAGDIVGQNSNRNDAGTQQRAFLYSKGTTTDLSALPEVLAAGWQLEDATAINDVGQIVGSGYRNGQQRAYLLSPTR